MAAERTRARQTQAGDPERGKLAEAATLATDLRDGMMRLHRRLRQVRPVGELTQTQLSALTSLELSAALTPRELAELERVQPPTMTRIVARLTELGLVQRVPHPTDGRQVILSTTARGREVLAENRRLRDAWLTKQLAALGDADRETLESAAAIMARIARTEASPPTGTDEASPATELSPNTE
jgi:DNA-binding MarR family transcriptional regulator